jgi:Cft2 family RNA processing exonuclease
VRDSKHAREREFLKAVHKCVSGGGKVLIPAFALGRAQVLTTPLLIICDDAFNLMVKSRILLEKCPLEYAV